MLDPTPLHHWFELQLVRYYSKPAPRYERLAIGFASAVGL